MAREKLKRAKSKWNCTKKNAHQISSFIYRLFPKYLVYYWLDSQACVLSVTLILLFVRISVQVSFLIAWSFLAYFLLQASCSLSTSRNASRSTVLSRIIITKNRNASRSVVRSRSNSLARVRARTCVCVCRPMYICM